MTIHAKMIHYFLVSYVGPELEEQATKMTTKGTWQGRRNSTRGLPQIVGAMDGKHIRIIAPAGQGDAYKDRHHQQSVLMLAAVNADYEYTYVSVGCSGRCHDVSHYERSSLYAALQPGGALTARLDSGTRVIEGVHMPYMLVADSAYTASKYVLPAIKQSLVNNLQQRTFNKKHSATRNVVERVFGVTVARWRVLLKRVDVHIDMVPMVVTTCCILHNLCQRYNLAAPDVAADPGLVEAMERYRAIYGSSTGQLAEQEEEQQQQQELMQQLEAAGQQAAGVAGAGAPAGMVANPSSKQVLAAMVSHVTKRV
jgi:DDE superfamily endonuclease